MSAPIRPIYSTNGSGRQNLLDDACDVLHAAQGLAAVMSRTGPNARDYMQGGDQAKGVDRLREDLSEWDRRCQLLAEIQRLYTADAEWLADDFEPRKGRSRSRS